MSHQIDAAKSLGFPDPVEVSGLRSVAHLFGSSKTRCGIYLLALPSDHYYIGQATDVVRRFGQHLKKHEIAGFAFLPTPRARLDKREKELIFQAESGKVVLVNVVHVSDVSGESDLEQLLKPSVLARWSANPFSQNRKDFATKPIRLPAGHVARYEGNLRRLQDHPCFRAAVAQLYVYLETAIPYPRTTEYSFWSVSCMPSTNQQSWPRLLCVSASVMEVFCLGYYKVPKFEGVTWGFMTVASDVLFSNFGSEAAFSKEFPDVEVHRRMYRDAGQHQVTLRTGMQNDMIMLLTDERVTKAAAELCLRLMRKRATIYFKFHCPQLVDTVMHHRGSTAKQLRAELISVCLPEEDEDSAQSPPPTKVRMASGRVARASRQ